jgi:hypothetical protein
LACHTNTTDRIVLHFVAFSPGLVNMVAIPWLIKEWAVVYQERHFCARKNSRTLFFTAITLFSPPSSGICALFRWYAVIV